MRKVVLLFIVLLVITFSIYSETEEGYYLFSPLANKNVYLIDERGEVKHQWKTSYGPGLSVYLLEDGSLLRSESIQSRDFKAGGSAGRVALYDASSNEIWSYDYASKDKLSHHDVEPLPNGNILILAWEKFSRNEAIANGLDGDFFKDNEIWADHIIEVNPTTDEIVWQWHVWDHLVQDYDKSLDNYGDVARNPGKINLNYFGSSDKIDWNHINSIDYNEEKDQILLSSHSFNEIWIINHNISSDEAKSSKGDLLYRWGNPEAYDTKGEQVLYQQHDAEWIDDDRIMVFNNGDQRQHPYSSVLELEYSDLKTEILWKYEKRNDFFAKNISSSQRLENGNTLICNGPIGRFFEVNNNNEIVWEYDNPFFSKTPKGEINEVFRVHKYSTDYPGILNFK